MADPIITPESDDPAASLIFAYAAPVQVRAKSGGGSDELLTIAKDRAPDPDALDEFPPFFFNVIPSTNSLDSYSTQMAATSLKNYATDFAEGRAFQDSHRHDEMPIGYSLTGKYVGSNGNGVARVESDFFIPRGVSTNGDAAIARIRTGSVKDVSIGFHGGQWRCSICGRDMLTDWDCWHIPGMSYSIDEKDMDFFFAQETARAKGKGKDAKKDDAPPERILCTASIENAHAAECSGVFDGATPGAVVKAQRMADAGRLTPAAARMVEGQFHVRIHGADQTWRGWTPPNQSTAPTERTTNPPKEGTDMTFEEEIRALLAIGSDVQPLDAVRALKERGDAGDTAMRGIRVTVKALGAPDDADAGAWTRSEIERLRPLADDGARYREDLIESALKEGVRAHGSDFAQETYKGVLASSPLETIKRFQADWKTQGDKTFAGGRQTGDDESGAQPIDFSERRKPSKRAAARV